TGSPSDAAPRGGHLAGAHPGTTDRVLVSGEEDRELGGRPRLALPEARWRGTRPLPPGVSLLAPARLQGAAPRAVRPRRIPRGVLRILLHRRKISASRAHARDEHRHPP